MTKTEEKSEKVDFPFLTYHKELYLRLENQNDNMKKIKFVLLVTFIIVTFMEFAFSKTQLYSKNQSRNMDIEYNEATYLFINFIGGIKKQILNIFEFSFHKESIKTVTLPLAELNTQNIIVCILIALPINILLARRIRLHIIKKIRKVEKDLNANNIGRFVTMYIDKENYQINKTVSKCFRLWKLLKGFISCIISPDYYYSLRFKKELISALKYEQVKQSRRRLIKKLTILIKSIRGKISSTEKKMTLEEHINSEDLLERETEIVEKYYSVEDGMLISNLEWSLIKIQRKYLIERTNWANLNATIMLFFIALLIMNFGGNEYANLFLITFLSLRLISRLFEVGLAFYGDVAKVNSKVFHSNVENIKESEKWDYEKKIEFISNSIFIPEFKSSLIRSEGRISLAVHTLMEFIVLYSIFYVFIDLIIDFDSKNLFGPLHSLLYSASLGFFNISYGSYDNIFLGLIHVSQVIISVILILLSLAQYLGKSRDVTNEENELYRYVHINRNKDLFTKK